MRTSKKTKPCESRISFFLFCSFLTTNPFFFRITVYFFTMIVHFSNLIDNSLVYNSQNPDTIGKKQIAFVQITTPIPPSKGLQKSLSAHPAQPHLARTVLRLKSLIIFDNRLTKNKNRQCLTCGIVNCRRCASFKAFSFIKRIAP